MKAILSEPEPVKASVPILVGSKYSHLTAVQVRGAVKGYVVWEFLCDCGATCLKVASKVKSEGPKFCSRGCPLHRKHISESRKTHGLTKSPLYLIYRLMVRRCYEKTNASWKYYGGRGVGVHSEWRKNFMVFYNDMYPSYRPGLQLDRVNNALGYSRKNCRWSTPSENCRNRRDSRTPGWALDLSTKNGIGRSTLYARLRVGVPLLKACTEPSSRLGTPQWALDAAKKNNVSKQAFYSRLKRGMSLEEASSLPKMFAVDPPEWAIQKAAALNISKKQLRARIRNGVPLEVACSEPMCHGKRLPTKYQK